MFKNLFLAAAAVVSACAMGQDHWWSDEDSRASADATGKSRYEIKRAVIHMDRYLPGGDAYEFEAGLNRMDGNVEDALISGLFCAHRQSILVRDQIIASRFPDQQEVIAATTGSDSAILAEETEATMRPLRMVMVESPHKDIDYGMALEILSADLTDTQRTLLANWWHDDENMRQGEAYSDRNEHMKDIVCRLLKMEARRADEPIYPSLYVHHTYPVIEIK